jgi:beta-xylosidase
MILYKGYFYCTNSYQKSISQYKLNGDLVTDNYANAFGGTPNNLERPNAYLPGAIAFDKNGNFYIANFSFFLTN